MTKSLFYLFFLVFAFKLNSQSAIIRGIVYDAESREQLPSAHILLQPGDRMGVSSEFGSFHFNELDKGIYTITVSYLGYESVTFDSIELVEQEQQFIEVRLRQDALQTSEVVVTATRNAQTLVSTPVSIEVVKAEEIENRKIRTFDQIFENVSGVQVSRTSGANVQALSIRGASEVAGGGTGNRVMLLIDGRPALSPESGGALWNLVPVNSIEKVEVVKGAYSALFGSSAMGGVINVITKNPGNKPQTHLGAGYGYYTGAPSYAEFDEYRDFYSLNFYHSNRIKSAGYVLDLSRKMNDGHKQKSGFELVNFFGKINYEISQNQLLTFSGNINKIENDTPATWLSRTNPYRAAPHRLDDYQYRKEYNFDLQYNHLLNDVLKYSSRIYYYHNDSEYIFNDNPGNDSTNVNIGSGQVVDEETISAKRLGVNIQFDLQAGEKHYSIAGVDLYYDKIVALPDTVLYGRHSAWNVGFYLQDELTLTDRLKVTAGARLDRYEIVGEFLETNFSPKIAFVYDLSERTTLRFLFAQAFRNPAIAERFIKFEQGGGLRFQPNPDLKSEKLDFSFEAGSRFQIGTGTYLDIAYFHNHYRDLISFQQIPNPENILLYRVVNLKEAMMKGVEVSVHYNRWRYARFHAGYTFLDAKDRSENRINDELAYKVKHSFHFSLTTGLRFLHLNLHGRYKSKINEVFIYPGSEPDANFLLHSNMAWVISNQLNVYLSIKNILDTQYEELERYRMPGRSFEVGMKLQL